MSEKTGMGSRTSAIKTTHRNVHLRPMSRVIDLCLYLLTDEPFTARGCRGCGVSGRCRRSSSVGGKTQILANVSTRYPWCFERLRRKDGWTPGQPHHPPLVCGRAVSREGTRRLALLGVLAVMIVIPADLVFCRILASAVFFVGSSTCAQGSVVTHAEVLEFSRELIHPGFRPRVGRQRLGNLVLYGR